MQWDITAPDGTVHTVDGETPEEAYGNLHAQVSKDVNEEYGHLPWYKKAMTAGTDIYNVYTDSALAGAPNRLRSWESGTPLDKEQYETEKARMRGGSASTAAELLGYLSLGRLLPTAGPAIASAYGGPAVVRGIVSGGTQALEGATQGGITSAIKGQDPTEGAVTGAEAGLGGAMLGGVASKVAPAVKSGSNYVKSFFTKESPEAVEAAKQAAIDAQIKEAQAYYAKYGQPKKVSQAAQRAARTQAAQDAMRSDAIDAFNQAETKTVSHAGGATSSGYDKAATEQFKRIVNDPNFEKVYSPEEQTAIKKIVFGDPAVRSGRAIGTTVSSVPAALTASGGLGGLGYLANSNPLLAGATAALPIVTGIAGKTMANAGTRANVQAAKDLINKVPAKPSALSPDQQKTIAKTLTALGINWQ